MSIILIYIPISSATTFTINITHDLTLTKKFFGGQGINGISYDNISDGIYITEISGLFGYYNRSANITIDLSETDLGNWIGRGGGIYGVAFESKNSGAYLVGAKIFGYYNKTANITEDLRGTLSSWTTIDLFGVAYDFINDGVYISGSDGTFGYYNRSKNSTEDLSKTSTILNGRVLDNVAYDFKNNGVYIADDLGLFAYYDRNTNTTIDLTETDPGDWIGSIDELFGVAYDSKNDGAYIVGGSGKFGYYSRATNITQDLSGTDIGDWIGSSDSISQVAYDSKNDGAYIVGASGIFGYYNRALNKTVDLTLTDAGNWISGNNLLSVAYDSINNGAYIGGIFGLFGYFSLNGVSTTDGLLVLVDLGSNVTLLFSSVTSAGVTTVTKSTSPPTNLTGFLVNGTYYDIITTATYSGNITVSLPYDPSISNLDAPNLKMYHYDKNLNTWVDVTTAVNVITKTITGTVSSLSPFAVGIPSKNFIGFLPPVDKSETRTFKVGSTVPIKFQLTDNDGNFVTNAMARLYIAKVVDVVEAEQEATSKNSKSGNVFRYDDEDNQYIFNLDTKGLSEGTWRIRAFLEDDSTSYTAQISLSDK